MAAFLALFGACQLCAQEPNSVTLVKVAYLLDPGSGHVLSPATVLIQEDKIKQVAPTQIHAPSGTKVIDLGNATLLPGFIDSHTHLFLDVIVPSEAEIRRHENSIRERRVARQAGQRSFICARPECRALDVIRAITVNAAEMLSWGDHIGAVEPGKFADLIAIRW